MNLSYIEKVAIAVTSNPNFFEANQTKEDKIKQVCDLLVELDKTVHEK